MGLRKEIINFFILSLLSIKYLIDRIKLYVGLSKEKYGICDPFEYKGVLFSSFMHKLERAVAAETYDNFRPDDIVIATYPKTGTHFVMEIVASIYKEKGLVPKDTPIQKMISLLEMNPPKFMLNPSKDKDEGALPGVESAKSPRIIMSHQPWSLLPRRVREGKVKVIHCTRNPKDTVCSMFHFFKKMGVMSSAVKWQDYVPWFIEGNVVGGSYFKYIREWYPNRYNETILNLHFEDMKKDLRGNVIRIAEFLNIELTDQQIDSVVTANTFENKKKEEGRNHPIYRKGKSGAWTSEITVDQNAMLDEWIQQEMEELEEFEIHYD